MDIENSVGGKIQKNKAKQFWVRESLGVLSAMRMHRVSGQIEKDPETRNRPWGNVTEHCLVEAARVEVLGRWIGLPPSIITEVKVGAVLHDFSKKQEIIVTKEANTSGASLLSVLEAEHAKSGHLLKEAGFSDKIVRLSGSAGGLVPQLVESQRILDKPILSDDDWAYLLVHYIDDCSIGSDWVKLSTVEEGGERINIIDFRARGNKANPTYEKVSQEATQQLQEYPEFEGMSNIDASSFVSHQIERRLAERIYEKTGELVDPYLIPELIDQKIREAIDQAA